jgi:hypothetical protein
MKVKVRGNEYKVCFKHYKGEEKTGDIKFKALTNCWIVDDYGNMHGAYGYAYCSIADNFQKSTGRKIALTRAIEPFTRAERKEIWDQYFQYVGYK